MFTLSSEIPQALRKKHLKELTVGQNKRSGGIEDFWALLYGSAA